MSKSKYEIFECDTCRRKIEKETDPQRPSFQNCTITYKCVGKLSKIGESNAKSNFPQTVDGLVNWVNRFDEQVTTNAVIQRQNLSILSGDNNISIAVLEGSPQDVEPLNLLLKSKKIDGVDFKEFIYNRSSNTSLVFGPDDSSSKITLRFTNTDDIKIFINGVEISNTLYVLNYVSNTIEFIPSLQEENNSIRVIVYEEPPEIIKSIQFTKTASYESAWSNVDRISIFDYLTGSYNNYKVYTNEDLNNLDINDILEFQNIDNTFILLSKNPWSNYDRVLNSLIKINDIANDLEVKYYRNKEGIIELDLILVNNLNFNILPNIKIIDINPLYPNISVESVSSTLDILPNKFIN